MHSFLDLVVSKVCRGCQWNPSVFDDRPRSWYRCRSCVLAGLLGSVHPIVFNGSRQHHSNHCVSCSFKFLRKSCTLTCNSLNICSSRSLIFILNKKKILLVCSIVKEKHFIMCGRLYMGLCNITSFVVTRQCARPFAATFVFGATCGVVVY